MQLMNYKTQQLNIDVISNEDEWELLLNKLITSNTYMKWSWGNYKIKSGWEIERLKITDAKSNQLLSCCQLQSKKKCFINIYLIQGGIHLSKGNNIKNIFEIIHEALYTYIKIKKNWLWIFIINYQCHNFEDADTSLMKIGFLPILTREMFTYLLFSENINTDRLSLSNNWRHNLKRAIKNDDLKIEWVSSYKEREHILSHLFEMYKKLTIRKNFTAGIDLSKAGDLLALDQTIIIAQAKLHEEVVAIRVASVCNDHVLDLLAASNEGAVKCYANYLLMWEMVLKTKELKKMYFDTGGIDPGSNIGTFNFKKGLKGTLTINGPLWCKGSNSLLEWTTRLFYLRT